LYEIKTKKWRAAPRAGRAARARIAHML